MRLGVQGNLGHINMRIFACWFRLDFAARLGPRLAGLDARQVLAPRLKPVAGALAEHQLGYGPNEPIQTIGREPGRGAVEGAGEGGYLILKQREAADMVNSELLESAETGSARTTLPLDAVTFPNGMVSSTERRVDSTISPP